MSRDPSFTAMVCKTQASCKRTQASWEVAVQEGKQMEGLKLVSRQSRKQRLALWAAGRGPDPSFTAMVFWCCGSVLGPEVCQTNATGKTQQAIRKLAVQNGR